MTLETRLRSPPPPTRNAPPRPAKASLFHNFRAFTVAAALGAAAAGQAAGQAVRQDDCKDCRRPYTTQVPCGTISDIAAHFYDASTQATTDMPLRVMRLDHKAADRGWPIVAPFDEPGDVLWLTTGHAGDAYRPSRAYRKTPGLNHPLSGRLIDDQLHYADLAPFFERAGRHAHIIYYPVEVHGRRLVNGQDCDASLTVLILPVKGDLRTVEKIVEKYAPPPAEPEPAAPIVEPPPSEPVPEEPTSPPTVSTPRRRRHPAPCKPSLVLDAFITPHSLARISDVDETDPHDIFSLDTDQKGTDNWGVGWRLHGGGLHSRARFLWGTRQETEGGSPGAGGPYDELFDYFDSEFEAYLFLFKNDGRPASNCGFYLGNDRTTFGRLIEDGEETDGSWRRPRRFHEDTVENHFRLGLAGLYGTDCLHLKGAVAANFGHRTVRLTRVGRQESLDPITDLDGLFATVGGLATWADPGTHAPHLEVEGYVKGVWAGGDVKDYPSQRIPDDTATYRAVQAVGILRYRLPACFGLFGRADYAYSRLRTREGGAPALTRTTHGLEVRAGAFFGFTLPPIDLPGY